MKLSIVIVNYNVKYFLEQCLLSVIKACQNLENLQDDFQTEIIVVDNNSVDGSNTMVLEKFGHVKLIANTQNLGFSKANNQGIKVSKGEFVLLLNPDTVVEEDTFVKTIKYLDNHKNVGGLGVKMIDGSGRFLPESKRGFPSPMTALYKITGLSKIFPRSKKFSKYHLGFLNNDEIHEVEILSGAFMLMRRNVLNNIGLLDEEFFMYGEDIDLSYRILLGGYKNVYFPETQIIHYKGESTKKGSLNYVFLFYKAMIIFAKKHFSQKNARIFSFFINIAIYVRAFLSILSRFLKSVYHPLIDMGLIFSGLLLSKYFWENNTGLGHGYPYPSELVKYLFPLYTLLWLLGLISLKTYKKPFQLSKIIKAILLGTILISTFYAFFEESFRYSRALIILGTLTTFFAAFFSRFFINFFQTKSFRFNYYDKLNIAIVGNLEEGNRVLGLLNNSQIEFSFGGFISIENEKIDVEKNIIGHISKLQELTRFYKINELIFCSKDISSSDIINYMTKIQSQDVVFRIAPTESLFVIGSSNKNQSGDYYTINIKLSIMDKNHQTNKRLLDFGLSLLFIMVSPVLIWFQKSILKYFKNLFQVVIGKKSLVGYNNVETAYQLPQIKEGILQPVMKENQDADSLKESNLLYAKNYNLPMDLGIIISNLNKLGN